jgi:hypothetical protein
MNPPIFTWLSADSEVNSLLYRDGLLRVWEDEIPQEAQPQDAYPAVRWFLVSGQPENYIGQKPGIDSGRFQVDVFAKTQADRDAIYNAVQNVLEDHGHEVNFNGAGQDPDTRQYFKSSDYVFWQNRA